MVEVDAGVEDGHPLAGPRGSGGPGLVGLDAAHASWIGVGAGLDHAVGRDLAHPGVLGQAAGSDFRSPEDEALEHGPEAFLGVAAEASSQGFGLVGVGEGLEGHDPLVRDLLGSAGARVELGTPAAARRRRGLGAGGPGIGRPRQVYAGSRLGAGLCRRGVTLGQRGQQALGGLVTGPLLQLRGRGRGPPSPGRCPRGGERQTQGQGQDGDNSKATTHGETPLPGSGTARDGGRMKLVVGSMGRGASGPAPQDLRR